jgi:hypothetical protein
MLLKSSGYLKSHRVWQFVGFQLACAAIQAFTALHSVVTDRYSIAASVAPVAAILSSVSYVIVDFCNKERRVSVRVRGLACFTAWQMMLAFCWAVAAFKLDVFKYGVTFSAAYLYLAGPTLLVVLSLFNIRYKLGGPALVFLLALIMLIGLYYTGVMLDLTIEVPTVVEDLSLHPTRLSLFGLMLGLYPGLIGLSIFTTMADISLHLAHHTRTQTGPSSRGR